MNTYKEISFVLPTERATHEKRVVITHDLYLSFDFDLLDEIFFKYLNQG